MFDLILVDFSWIYNKYYYVAKVRPLREDNNLTPQLYDMLYRFFTLVDKNYPSSKKFLVIDPPLSGTENIKIYSDYKQQRNK